MSLKEKLCCQTLGCQMGHALKAILKTLNNYFCQHGLELTVEQMYLLLILDAETEELIQQDLADMTGKDKSAVYRQVDALEKKHLVARMESADDRRKKVLVLTKHGVEILEKARALEKEVMDKIAVKLTPQELETFEEVLKKIYENANSMYNG